MSNPHRAIELVLQKNGTLTHSIRGYHPAILDSYLDPPKMITNFFLCVAPIHVPVRDSRHNRITPGTEERVPTFHCHSLSVTRMIKIMS